MRLRTLPAPLLLALGLLLCLRAHAGFPGTLAPKNQRELNRLVAELPLHFEPEEEGRGFTCRGNGYSLRLSPTETRLTLLSDRRPRTAGLTDPSSDARPATPARAAIRTKLVGAADDATLRGAGELPGKVHYLIGNTPENWRRDVRTYRKVRASSVYPGIDLVYYGRQGQLEYDFVVSPHASPARIRMAISGPEGVEIDGEGNLRLLTPVGTVVQKRPELYQVVEGVRRSVEGAFTLAKGRTPGGAAEVGFRVGEYDRRLPLIIDPVLSYSTYLGGIGADSVDDTGSIKVDEDGYIYVTGLTASSDFPTENALQQVHRSGPYSGYDAFLTKLRPDGAGIVYSTFFGGSGEEWRMDLGLTPAGNPVLLGSTASQDFPTTVGALKRTLAGPYDVFLAEFNANGSNLIFSTLLGGNQREWSMGLAVGEDGALYVTGLTESANYPTTAGAFRTTKAGWDFDAFLTKVAPTGGSLTYSTFLGGTSYDHPTGVAVSPAGEATVCGFTSSADFPLLNPIQGTFQGGFPASLDGFVARFNPAGSALQYSTYLGGLADEACTAVTLDEDGNTYIAGNTSSANFPTTVGAFSRVKSGAADGFLAKLNPAGTGFVYSTLVGGLGWDGFIALAVDHAGRVWATGTTASADFPTASPTQPGQAGENDACVLQLSAAGNTLLFSTYLGGNRSDAAANLALGPDGTAWIVGSTASENLPTTAAALQPTYGGGTQDVFIARYGSPVPLAPTGFTAVATSPTSVVLAWTDNANDETGFRLERKGGGQGTFTELVLLGAGATGHIDSGVAPSTTYTYRVQAFSEAGASGYAEASVTTPAPPTFSLSGTVWEGNSPLPGVSITVGGQTAVTDASGQYQVSGLLAGTYTVAPFASEFTFTPPSQEVTLGPSRTLDFVALRKTYSVSGRIVEKGAGIPGVTVHAGGRSALTDTEGEYELSGLPAGSYGVVPEKSGFVFDPQQRIVTVGPSASSFDFAANSGPYLQSITLRSETVRSRRQVKGTLTLNRPATATVVIRLASDNPAAAPAPRQAVRIPRGKTTGSFVIQAKKVNTATPVTLSATHGGVTREAEVTVVP